MSEEPTAIVVKIERSDFDSALTNQGALLEGSITIGDYGFSCGWQGLTYQGQQHWWKEAKSLFSSARRALEKFEAESLGHGCFYRFATLTWDGRRWLLDATHAVRYRSGGNGYGTSIAI